MLGSRFNPFLTDLLLRKSSVTIVRTIKLISILNLMHSHAIRHLQAGLPRSSFVDQLTGFLCFVLETISFQTNFTTAPSHKQRPMSIAWHLRGLLSMP